jgi:hypothetical protein
MPNAVAVIGLTFRGVDIQRGDFGLFLEIVRGLEELPEVRGKDTVIPGLAGRMYRNRVVDRLPVELRGMVVGNGADETAQRSDLRTNMDFARALFNRTAAPGPLVATLENGATRTIVARPLNLLKQIRIPSMYDISVELESVAFSLAIGGGGAGAGPAVITLVVPPVSRSGGTP